jgi:Ni/Fe-hydrogenase subunit HybB-like protein
MVLTLLLPARAIFKLQDVITPQHIDKMAKIILLTGSFVGYAYMMEFFVAWYSGNSYERFGFWNRVFGPYWWYWWVGMLFCNVLSPQLFWFEWCRRNVYVVYFVCMCVNAGMWFERFIIIVGGLHRDFLPSSWGLFIPTWVDIWTYVGTLGIFTSLFLLFIRFLPMIAMSEVKTAVPEADPHYGTPPGVQSVPPGGKERTR